MDEKRINLAKELVANYATSLADMSRTVAERPDKIMVQNVLYDVESDIDLFCRSTANKPQESPRLPEREAEPAAESPIQNGTEAKPSPDFNPFPAYFPFSDQRMAVEQSTSSPPLNPFASPELHKYFDDEEDEPRMSITIKEPVTVADEEKQNELLRKIAGEVTHHRPESVAYDDTMQRTRTVSSSEIAEEAFESILSQTLSEKPIACLDIQVEETINVLFSQGKVSKILVTGQVFGAVPQSTHATLHFEGVSDIECIVPNENFVSPIGVIEGSFAFNSAIPEGTPLFKYQVRARPSEDMSPLLLDALWKFEQGKTSVLVGYQVKRPLSDLNILVDLQVPAEDHVGSVQMKPDGILNDDKSALLWQLGTQEPNSASTEEAKKLLAQFEHNGTFTHGSVAAKFTIPDVLLSKVGFRIEQIPNVLDSHRVVLGRIEEKVVAGTFIVKAVDHE